MFVDFKSHTTSMTICVMITVCVFGIAHAQTSDISKNVHVELGDGPVKKSGEGIESGYETCIYGTRALSTGEMEATGLLLYVHRRILDTDKNELRKESVTINYGPVREGDSIPYLGSVYRVSSISSPPAVVMRRIEERELAKGVVYPVDQYGVPVGGMLQLGESRLFVLSTSVTVNSVGKKPRVARIQLSIDLKREEPKDVTQGDTFKIGEYLYKVEAVVPTDGDQKIIGWILIEPVADAPAIKKSSTRDQK